MSQIPELRRKPGHLLWRAQQLGWQYFAEEMHDSNITPVQEVVLFALRRRPHIDVKTLANLVALDRSTTGDVVSRLEQRGFIDRAPDKNDRRAWSLSLTSAGEEFTDKLVPITKKTVERFLSTITPREQEELMRILRKLVGMADHVDLQDAPAFRSDRLTGRSVMLIGSGNPSERLSKRLEAQGAQVTRLLLRSDVSNQQLEKEMKRIKKSYKPTAIVISSTDLEELAPAFDDYGAIQKALANRFTALRTAYRLFSDNDYLRIVNVGLFPPDDLKEEPSCSAIAINRSIVIMTERLYSASLELGAVMTSITPRLLTEVNSRTSTVTTRCAPVSELDISACICFLVSSDSRAMTSPHIELGMMPVKTQT